MKRRNKLSIIFFLLLLGPCCLIFILDAHAIPNRIEDIDPKIQKEVLDLKYKADLITKDYLKHDSLKELDTLSKRIIDNATQQKENSVVVDHKNHIHYLFVSLSMPRANIINLAREAKKLNDEDYQITIVLRGFKNGSYKQTAFALQEIIDESGMGMIVDPNLFKKYNVNIVPTFVEIGSEKICPANMSCLPGKYNKIAGNITLEYAFKLMTEEGDLL